MPPVPRVTLHTIVQPARVVVLHVPEPGETTTIVPRARHCRLPSSPAFPDTDAAIDAAPGLIDRVARLREGRDARIAYEREQAAALRACGR